MPLAHMEVTTYSNPSSTVNSWFVSFHSATSCTSRAATGAGASAALKARWYKKSSSVERVATTLLRSPRIASRGMDATGRNLRVCACECVSVRVSVVVMDTSR